MNKTFCKYLKILILSGLIASVFSCDYETKYRDADYPEQLIYMPAAVGSNGLFVIDNIARETGVLPFPGYPYRYVVDMQKREFRIPLSVYRSGVDNKGAFTVNIKAGPDTINTINEGRTDKYLLIPADKYSIAGSVEMKNGENLASFDLVIDIDLLRNGSANDIYALGVGISSNERSNSPKLCTTAVIIHSKILKPDANFTFVVDESNSKRVTFTNSSTMATDYQWNFGDGSAVSNDNAPSHIYSSAGVYSVSLTAMGITGDEDISVINIDVTIE